MLRIDGYCQSKLVNTHSNYFEPKLGSNIIYISTPRSRQGANATYIYLYIGRYTSMRGKGMMIVAGDYIQNTRLFCSPTGNLGVLPWCVTSRGGCHVLQYTRCIWHCQVDKRSVGTRQFN